MLTLAAIWGCSFLFISVGVRELPPLYLALGRVIAGALVLLVFLAFKRESLPRDPRIWAHTFVVGAIGSAIPWTLFGYGEQRIPSLLAGHLERDHPAGRAADRRPDVPDREVHRCSAVSAC